MQPDPSVDVMNDRSLINYIIILPQFDFNVIDDHAYDHITATNCGKGKALKCSVKCSVESIGVEVYVLVSATSEDEKQYGYR